MGRDGLDFSTFTGCAIAGIGGLGGLFLVQWILGVIAAS